MPKLGRNSKCGCGSGVKAKLCCLDPVKKAAKEEAERVAKADKAEAAGGGRRAANEAMKLAMRGQTLRQSGQYAEAFKIIKRSAETGLPEAQVQLAEMLRNGEVERDYPASLAMYRLAADAGHMDAQFNLASMLQIGQGLAKPDLGAAFVEYGRAAAQGDADARFNLGGMHRDGLGVPINPVAAMVEFRRAANQGDAKAQCELGSMLLKGSGATHITRSAQEEALALFRLSAAQGNAPAAANIATCEASLARAGNDEMAAAKANLAASRALKAAGASVENVSDVAPMLAGLRLERACGHCGEGTKADGTALDVCQGCKQAFFCSKACITAAWPKHQDACEEAKREREELKAAAKRERKGKGKAAEKAPPRSDGASTSGSAETVSWVTAEEVRAHSVRELKAFITQ